MKNRGPIMEEQVGNIVFGYWFVWDGLSTYKGNKVDGAGVDVAVHVYKDGSEVLLDDEPLPYTDIYFSDIFDVSYHPEKGVLLEKNANIAELFQILWGYDDIRAEIVGYHLDSHRPLPEEMIRDYIPAEYRYETSSQCEEVEADEFLAFMLKNADGHCLQKGVEARVGVAKIVPLKNGGKVDDFTRK